MSLISLFVTSMVSPNPTEVMFCNFIVYMLHHIQLHLVASYLSGICSKLVSSFPAVRVIRRLPSVTKTLQGCHHQLGSPPTRKVPLTAENLLQLFSQPPFALSRQSPLPCPHVLRVSRATPLRGACRPSQPFAPLCAQTYPPHVCILFPGTCLLSPSCVSDRLPFPTGSM